MAEPLFDAYLMVDWSAANAPKTGGDSIWLALAERGGAGLRLACPENPPTRAGARERLETLLAGLLKRGRRVLAGFDFPFGYPAGTAAALKLDGEPWPAMWELLAREIEDDAANRSNRFEVAERLNGRFGRRLFWGRPGAPGTSRLRCLDPEKSGDAYRRGIGEKRLVEGRYVPRAQPVWKLAYPGSVGSQALTGLPVVEALRRRFGCRCRVWPFQTGLKTLARRDLPAILLAEIYPSLVEPRSSRREVEDSRQVQAVALHLAAEDEGGALARAFAGPPCLSDTQRRRVEREEGWILGVTRAKQPRVPIDIGTAHSRHG